MLADLNLVLAHVKEEDSLKSRADRFLARRGRLTVTFVVGLELLMWCRKHRLSYVDYVDRMLVAFDAEEPDVLLTAARALQDGLVTSPFDAAHLAEALHRSEPLATADEALWSTAFPVERF